MLSHVLIWTPRTSRLQKQFHAHDVECFSLLLRCSECKLSEPGSLSPSLDVAPSVLHMPPQSICGLSSTAGCSRAGQGGDGHALLQVMLPNGLRIFMLEDHEVPVVHGTLLMRGGQRASPSNKVCRYISSAVQENCTNRLGNSQVWTSLLTCDGHRRTLMLELHHDMNQETAAPMLIGQDWLKNSRITGTRACINTTLQRLNFLVLSPARSH